MKLITTHETAGNGKRRILFATNKDELKLIHGLLVTAHLHFPSTPKFSIQYNRLGVIVKTLAKAINQLGEED